MDVPTAENLRLRCRYGLDFAIVPCIMVDCAMLSRDGALRVRPMVANAVTAEVPAAMTKRDFDMVEFS